MSSLGSECWVCLCSHDDWILILTKPPSYGRALMVWGIKFLNQQIKHLWKCIQFNQVPSKEIKVYKYFHPYMTSRLKSWTLDFVWISYDQISDTTSVFSCYCSRTEMWTITTNQRPGERSLTNQRQKEPSFTNHRPGKPFINN